MTQFLLEQKIVTKHTELNYHLENNSQLLNTLWTFRQIKTTQNLELCKRLTFVVRIKEDEYEYGSFQKRK